MFIREPRTTEDDLLNRAFGLAYFILGDRAASIYVTMAAVDKLKTAMSNQARRLYYTPTGRATFPAARTKVNLSESQLLQRLIYAESELFERLLEGQQKRIRQEDLIIRYVKHLVRITMKHNSFYVALGLCRLLYNFSTKETSEIYNLVLQDPGRTRDDYYYRYRKKLLIEEITERFEDLISIQRGLRGEKRFQPQEDSQKYVGLVQECLTRFTPWQSTCVLPGDFDPNRNVLKQLLFAGGHPDEEHLVELNRIHTIIHPACFTRLTSALGLNPIEKRLELPRFLVSGEGSRPGKDRFNLTELTEVERRTIRRYLNGAAMHRKAFSGAQVKLFIDGRWQADFELDYSRSVNFVVEDGAELLEVRSAGSLDTNADTPLAYCLLEYDHSGICPADSSVMLGGKQRLSLMVVPSLNASGDARGATLKISYQEVPSKRAIFLSPRQIGSWLYELIGFRPQIGFPILKPVLALLFITLSIVGLWALFRSAGDQNNPQIAKLQEDTGKEIPPPIPTATPKAQTSPSVPPENVRQTNGTGLVPTKRKVPGADRPKSVPAVRSTQLATSMLLSVKRVHVDPLGNDSFSQMVREKLVDSLRVSNRFEVVENRDDADAVFKGSVVRDLKEGSNPVIVLRLVNEGGQVVWSFSSRNGGRILTSDPAEIVATILSLLLHDIKTLEGRRQGP